MDLPLMNESAAEGSYGWAGRRGGRGEGKAPGALCISSFGLDTVSTIRSIKWLSSGPIIHAWFVAAIFLAAGKGVPGRGRRGGKGVSTRGARELLIRDLHIKLTDLSPTPEHRRAIRPYFLSPHLAPNADDRLILASMFASDVVFRSD